jgi:Tripartite tricarboxylate transporter TctB family
MRNRLGRARLGSIASALVVLAFVLAYIATGYFTLEEASRRVPILVGVVTVLLLAVELARQSLLGGESAAPVRVETNRHTEEHGTRGKEWQVLLSVAAAIAGIYLFGFMIAIPAYLVGAIKLVGQRPLRVAVLTAFFTTTTIYVAFELLLSYELSAGLLFN